MYTLQARAIGGTTGCSDWSDPVSHMAMQAVEKTRKDSRPPGGFEFFYGARLFKPQQHAPTRGAVNSNAIGLGTRLRVENPRSVEDLAVTPPGL